VLCLYYCYYYC